MTRRGPWGAALALGLAACATTPQPAAAPPPAAAPAEARVAAPPDVTRAPSRAMRPLNPPIVPPEVAFQRGWMPLAATGVPAFAREHPTWDGRGVLIAILDSGIDPTVPGLLATTTGDRKVVDLRDFSAEGRITLSSITSKSDTVTIAGQRLGGMSRVRALNNTGPWYGGTIAELVLGDPNAADLNGDGDVADTLAVVVTRAPDGWVVFADQGGDGTLSNDRPVHDYLVARESFGWSVPGATPYVALAANFSEAGGQPVLDLYFDTSAHGSHVAGIAAGHNLYGIEGFDGVAPGAQLLGLKIADDAQGGISRTGSMLRAMDYAIRFAERRQQPLVMNMSFGVGNEIEGTAVMDRLVDSVMALHPNVVFTLSAGNEGPGISTIGFPGSANRIISVAALFPGLFLSTEGETHAPADAIADFSSRGGEVAAPHLTTPGVAYSTVPLWNRGGEREGGTSMAAPHAAGLAARLLSAASQEGKQVTARAVRQALMVTAQPVPGATYIDQGTGVPDLRRAWSWLSGHPDIPALEVSARPGVSGVLITEAASGIPQPARFTIRRAPGGKALPLRFKSSVPWLTPPRAFTLTGDSAGVEVPVRRTQVAKPGVHVGVVSAWTTDSTLGPLARLVTTVVVPHREDHVVQRGITIQAGELVRVPFEGHAGRPIAIRVTAASAGGAIAYLHEPEGMPYRDGHSRPAGEGEDAASFDVLAQDAVDGIYELVIQASPFADATVDVSILQSPVSIAVKDQVNGLEAQLRNLTTEGVRAEVGAAAIGVARSFDIASSGSARQDVQVSAPSWARGVQVEVTMDRAAWSRFTDFGVTLFDSAGMQLAKSPLNYALGRLEHELTPGGSGQSLRVGLFPGFALPSDSAPWKARVTVRFYVDSARPLAPTGDRAVTLGSHESGGVRFAMVPLPSVPPGFGLLGLVLVRTDDEEIWAAEAILPPREVGARE